MIPGIIYNCLLVNLVITYTGCCLGRAYVCLAHSCESPPFIFNSVPITLPFLHSTLATLVSLLFLKLLGLLLPQGLCTCWAICPEGILTQISAWLILIFFTEKSSFWWRLLWSLCLKLYPPWHFTLSSSALFLSLRIATVYYMAHFVYLLSVSPTRMKTPWVSVFFFVVFFLLLYAQYLK